jgi:hypothetical protein
VNFNPPFPKANQTLSFDLKIEKMGEEEKKRRNLEAEGECLMCSLSFFNYTLERQKLMLDVGSWGLRRINRQVGKISKCPFFSLKMPSNAYQMPIYSFFIVLFSHKIK